MPSFALSSDSRHVVVRPNQELARLGVPHKIGHKHGQPWMVFENTYDTAKILRNIGYAVPPPILHLYDWAGTTPFDTQKQTAAMLSIERRAYVLNDMGTGKTRAALFAFDYLKGVGLANKMLVVAPLSTLNVVWVKEVFDCFPHLTATVLHANGIKARSKLLDMDSDIYVINHDGVGVFCDKVPGRYGRIHIVLKPVLADRTDIDVVLIDELGMLRNAQTHRWKAMEALIKGRPRVWGMTGGPIPHSPTDAWAQVRLLTPSQVPSAFTRFREEIMFQAGPWGWKPKPEALDTVWSVMRPAVRFTRDQCLDLPPTTYSERVAPLTAEQEKAYKEMTRESAIFHQGQHITAFNAAIKANKCLQAACGMMIGNDGVTVRFDNKPRLNLLTDLIDQAAAKVIVFVPFKDALRQVADHVAKDYTVDTVSGDTPKHERDRIFTDFQQQENPHVIVAHPKVMAHGLTLTQADTIIWYAVMPDLDIYDQACGRITRVNQTRRTHIIHIVSTQVERKIADTLQRRGNIQAALLEMYKTETNLKGV